MLFSWRWIMSPLLQYDLICCTTVCYMSFLERMGILPQEEALLCSWQILHDPRGIQSVWCCKPGSISNMQHTLHLGCFITNIYICSMYCLICYLSIAFLGKLDNWKHLYSCTTCEWCFSFLFHVSMIYSDYSKEYYRIRSSWKLIVKYLSSGINESDQFSFIFTFRQMIL